ncbi:tetratricopeptide repeat protein [Dyella sp. C9]|uniref:tetratricopeptide repeat protein n=1 Tax=Dyella sp. C9 TaxID=2202154 RepID=UPI000DEFA777|nr:sel1 repeat family protein [Dyella sp. C9]
MALQKHATLPLLCLAAGFAFWPVAGIAGDQDALKTIPIDAQTPAAAPVATTTTDTGEDNSKAFNTPLDDARPGEYFFALGAQAARKGDYTHAIAMYKVAASWAYKPAEYNLGVMYLSGQGSAVDLPQAMAWMALAAERNDPQYVRARQLVYAHLTPEQFAKANEIWRDLLPTYGDEAALPRAKARWREVRQNATGSRVGSSAAHVEVGGIAGVGNHMSSPIYDISGGGAVTQTGLQRPGGGPNTSDPAQVVGAHQTDGAVAYQELRSTDNPYDPRLPTTITGTVSVGPLSPVKPPEGDDAKDKNEPTTGSSDQGHP